MTLNVVSRHFIHGWCVICNGIAIKLRFTRIYFIQELRFIQENILILQKVLDLITFKTLSDFSIIL